MKKVVDKAMVRKIIVLIISILIMLFVVDVYTVREKNKQKVQYEHYDENQMLTEQVLMTSVGSEIYSIQSGYITKILPETTLRDLKNNLNNEKIKVFDKQNREIKDDELVGTGMKLKISKEEYKLVVLGDTTGDGKIGITDLVQVRLNQVGIKNNLVDEYKKAADMNFSGDLTITDVTRANLALVDILDVKAPNSFVPEAITTKDTITIKGETSDTNSGVKEYWFELNSDGWVQNSDVKKGEYKFENLVNDAEYTIRMKVSDNVGNIKITKRVKVRTLDKENANIKIDISTEEWTNENITISVTFSSNIAKETKQISLNGGSTWQEYTGPVSIDKNTTVKARVINSNGDLIEEKSKEITNIDKIVPKEFTMTSTSETNSITVSASAEDAEATQEYGKSEIKEYEYKLIQGTFENKYVTTDTSYTFENLTQGTDYKVVVIARDNAGNERIAKNSAGTEGEESIKTPTVDDIVENEGLGEITITPSITSWTKEDITVEVTYPDIAKFTKEVSIDNGQSWFTYTQGVSIDKNTIVKARFIDNKGQTSTEKSLEIKNIDRLEPQNVEMETTTVTTNSITVSASAEDAEETQEYGKSGIQGYKFKINNDEWTTIQTSRIYTFENLNQGEYYTIKVKAVDNAGNELEIDQGEIVKTPTIDEIIQTEDLGEIIIKSNTTQYTNIGVTVEAIYPDVSGLIKEISIDNGTNWQKYEESVDLTNNTTVKARLKDSKGQTGAEKSLEIENIDKLLPKTFSISASADRTSITVSANTDDAEKTNTDAYSGIREYKYILVNGVWRWEVRSSNLSHEFNNLLQGKTYGIEVIAVDNAGNERIAENSGTTTVKTPLEGNITMSADRTAWTKENVIVTATYPANTDGLIKEISTDGGVNWQDYSNINTKVTITSNTTVKARMRDGTEQIGAVAEYLVTNIDKELPNDFTFTDVITAKTVTIQGYTTDNISGIQAYYFSKDNGVSWQTNSEPLTTSYKYTGLQPATSYNIKMKAVDKAGNERIVSKTITTASEYTLTVNTNGGSYSGSTSIIREAGSVISLGTPTRSGYNFTGWSKTNGTGTLSGSTFTFGNGNATVTANWEEIQYTLTINANGGTYNGVSSTTISKVPGTTITLGSPTRSGYNFTGWSKTSGTGTLSGNTFTFGNGNATVTANWTASQYTLTYNANGGTVSPTYTTANYNASISMPTPTRSYKVNYSANGGSVTPTSATATYSFSGWYTSASGGTLRTYSRMPATNETLYAHWNERSLRLPTPTKSGYRFDGWYSNSGLTSYVGAGGYTYTPTSNITLYAKWTANTCTITYETNGGTLSQTQVTATIGTAITLPTPTKSGYRFDGWYSNSGLTSYVGSGGDSYTPTSAVTLYAKWTANTCTITYETNGGTLSQTQVTATIGTAITLPTPTKSGYRFDGWYSNITLFTYVGSGGDSYTPTSNVTLYAKWKLAPLYIYNYGVVYEGGLKGTGMSYMGNYLELDGGQLITNTAIPQGYKYAEIVYEKTTTDFTWGVPGFDVGYKRTNSDDSGGTYNDDHRGDGNTNGKTTINVNISSSVGYPYFTIWVLHPSTTMKIYSIKLY